MRFLFGLIAVLSLTMGGPAVAKQKTGKKAMEAATANPSTAPRTPPPPITDTENIWYLDLSTGGRVVIRLYPNVAPKMVERIKVLTRQHFYDGLRFHRVIDGFMAQTGDPKGDGTGGSSLPDVPAEFNWMPHVRGAVAAAREGSAPDADAETKKKAEDSANSQFFIVFQPRLSLDKKYTVFGRVISGMEYVDAVARGEPPSNPSTIAHAYIAADNPPGYAPPPPAATLTTSGTPALTAPKSVKPTPKPAAKKK